MIKYQLLEDDFVRNVSSGTLFKLGVGAESELYVQWLQSNTPMSVQPSKFHVFNESEMIWELDETAEFNEEWEKIRLNRDRLLKDSDFTQLADAPFNQETKDLWTLYREELRDIPTAFINPEDVVFPTTPV